MEPVTHTLASLALARAGLKNVTRLATPMVLICGLAPDLDWFSRAAGPRAFLASYRILTHSLPGVALVVLATAGTFWWLTRRHAARQVQFSRAVLVCGVSAAIHVLSDLTNSYGVQLLWPFRDRWFAWDLLASIDPWILILLLLGLLLPGLFRLVSEEIGAHAKPRGRQRGAIVALLLVTLYIGGRWALHARAVEMLRSRIYHDQQPLTVGAFPEAGSPLTWRGVVETENALEQLDVSFSPGSLFDPDLARTQYKPEAPPVLDAARKSEVARKFLQFARFPKATVERTEEGYRVELRDLRFASLLPGRSGFTAVVELNRELQVIRDDLHFGTGDMAARRQ